MTPLPRSCPRVANLGEAERACLVGPGLVSSNPEVNSTILCPKFDFNWTICQPLVLCVVLGIKLKVLQVQGKGLTTELI